MQKILLLALFIPLIWGQFRQDLNKYRRRYAVETEQRQDIAFLKKSNIEFDYCSTYDGKKLFVYITPQEVERIQQHGLNVEPAPVVIGKNSLRNSYHSYEDFTQELQQLANQYSQIARLESVGKSVQGRELWIMKISDNVGQDEAEPEVKYVSTMHGDEPVGQELMIYLINHLLSQYGKDQQVTDLVNGLEMWIMPCMNPDGYTLKRRYNADWIDLNRNFPDPDNDPQNNPQGRAIEVQHLMKFTADHNFSISINFHTGALVVNYPWDTKAGNVPDIELTKHLSLGYSKRNNPMYNSAHFKNGITNGYDWYEVNGGMQDWNYFWHNDLEVTLELSDRKWPDAEKLPQLWQDNQASLLWFLAQSFRGVHGQVTDASTKKPVKAKIEVVEIGKAVTTSNAGDYHRVLLPGVYTIKFSAPGYQEMVYNNIELTEGKTNSLSLNVELNAK